MNEEFKELSPEELQNLYGDLIKESQEARENREEEWDDTGVAYLAKGTYWLRFKPEIVKTNGKNKVRVIRKLHVHNIKDVGKFICTGENCVICKELKRAEENKVDMWKSKAQLMGLARVNIYGKRIEEESKYLKEGEDLVIVLFSRAVYQIEDYLSDMEPKDAVDLLHSPEERNVIQLSWSKQSGKWVCNVGLHSKKKALIPSKETPT